MNVSILKSGLSLAAVFGVFTAEADGGRLRAYRTTSAVPFAEVSDETFAGTAEGAALDLDGTFRNHPFLGLGVSFVESACRVLSELDEDARQRALRMIWSATEGAGLSVARLNVGCSDFSTCLYTYDDVADDFGLKYFSIDQDRRYVLPVVREAMKVNPEIYFFASPWTPPAWMKLGRDLCGGWIDPDRLEVYGDYYVKYLQAYRAEGIPIRAITMQNEPFSDQGGDSPDCIWGPNEEIAFASRILPPRLKRAGLDDVRVWLMDAEPKMWRQADWELAVPEIRAVVGGVAWHSYGSEPEDMLPLREKYPDLPMYHTEMGPQVDREKRPLLWWGEIVLRYLNAGCRTFTGWCMALDEQGLPNTSRGFNCAGLIEIHSETHAIRPSRQWELFRQIGPYVKRGAKILETGVRIPGVKAFGAFANPDGTHVVVAVTGSDGATFGVRRRGAVTSVRLKPDAVTTLIFGGEEVRQ